MINWFDLKGQVFLGVFKSPVTKVHKQIEKNIIHKSHSCSNANYSYYDINYYSIHFVIVYNEWGFAPFFLCCACGKKNGAKRLLQAFYFSLLEKVYPNPILKKLVKL